MISGYWYYKTFAPVNVITAGDFIGVRRPERFRITVAEVGEVTGFPYTFPINFLESG